MMLPAKLHHSQTRLVREKVLLEKLEMPAEIPLVCQGHSTGSCHKGIQSARNMFFQDFIQTGDLTGLAEEVADLLRSLNVFCF